MASSSTTSAASGGDGGAGKIWESAEWKALQQHVADIDKTHLRELMEVR